MANGCKDNFAVFERTWRVESVSVRERVVAITTYIAVPTFTARIRNSSDEFERRSWAVCSQKSNEGPKPIQMALSTIQT